MKMANRVKFWRINNIDCCIMIQSFVSFFLDGKQNLIYQSYVVKMKLVQKKVSKYAAGAAYNTKTRPRNDGKPNCGQLQNWYLQIVVAFGVNKVNHMPSLHLSIIQLFVAIIFIQSIVCMHCCCCLASHHLQNLMVTKYHFITLLAVSGNSKSKAWA